MRKKDIGWVIGGGLVLMATVIAASSCSSAEAEGRAGHTHDQAVARGGYLVSIMGCHDCHTPLTMGPNGPEPDMTRALSGHPEQIGALRPPRTEDGWMMTSNLTNTAFNGPWGISYAQNLTPDQNTGLGIWTEDMFVNAIRLGKHMGVSRPIMPPMPWPVFRNATDDDLKAIFAYLRSIPAITNHVPDVQPAEPAAVRSDN